MKKKLFASFLVVAMLLTLMPVVALGAPTQQGSSTMAVTIGGTTTYYDSQEDGWNAAVGSANTSGATVKLLDDWTAKINTSNSDYTFFGTGDGFTKSASAIFVPNQKEIILDLNGYAIDKANPKVDTDGSAIRVLGTLTLCDSGNTGTVTGCYDSAGAIVIEKLPAKSAFGNFTMTGGTITGNKGSTDNMYCSGVFVNEDTTFTMKGGRIIGNNDGSGVCNYGSFIMEGGEISGNKAAKGGGVYVVGSGTLDIKGTTPIVFGNTLLDGITANNVYLLNGKYVNIESKKANGALIGVTTETSPTSPINITVDSGSDNSAYFVSDSDAYTAINSGSGSTQKVQLVPSTLTIATDKVAAAYNNIPYSQQLSPDMVTYSLVGAPSWLNISGNTLAGTPTADGKYTFFVKAKSGSDYGQKLYTLEVLPTPSASVSDVTVGGRKDEAIASKDVVITLKNCEFAKTITNYSWFTNLPTGLNVTGTRTSDTEVTLTVSGTPVAFSSGAMSITIPSKAIAGVGTDLVVSANANATWSIGESPATGDSSMLLRFIILIVAGIGMVSSVIIYQKKQTSK